MNPPSPHGGFRLRQVFRLRPLGTTPGQVGVGAPPSSPAWGPIGPGDYGVAGGRSIDRPSTSSGQAVAGPATADADAWPGKLGGNIRQHLGETIRCRFGRRKKAEGYKFFFNKALRATLTLRLGVRVLRKVAIVLPPDLGVLCRDEPRGEAEAASRCFAGRVCRQLGGQSSVRNSLIFSAAFRPEFMALATRDAPVTRSPAAKTPPALVEQSLVTAYPWPSSSRPS